MTNADSTPVPNHNHVLLFTEDTHTYEFGGEKFVSVTAWVKRFAQPFDEAHWSKYVAKRDGKPVEQVLKEWADKRDESCRMGTDVHSFLEHIMLGYAKREDGFFCPRPHEDSEYVNWKHAGLRWIFDHYRYIRPHTIQPEWRVAHPDLGLAGTIDLYFHGSIRPVLLDWKTNAAIKTSNKYQKMKAPFGAFDDCNWNHYCLQMNTYRVILKDVYDIDCNDMHLVHLLPGAGGYYQDLSVPDMEDLVRAAMKETL